MGSDRPPWAAGEFIHCTSESFEISINSGHFGAHEYMYKLLYSGCTDMIRDLMAYTCLHGMLLEIWSIDKHIPPRRDN